MPAEFFLSDVREPEGPVFAPDGSFYMVEMAGDRACVTGLRDGVRARIARTAGRPNGLALDGDGNIWIAEAGDGTVVCIDPAGRVLRRIVDDVAGGFLWPNDLAFGPDGLLYLTDSGIRPGDFIDGLAIRADFASIAYDGRVYQIDPVAGTVLRVLDRGFRFTNGIAFDAVGRLYVAETLSGDIVRYDLPAGSLARTHFANVLGEGEMPSFRGPDGMAFDERGVLYCAIYNESCVKLVDPVGSIAGTIPVKGTRPTNLAFAPGSSTIYVTEVETSSVQAIEVGHGGLSLHCPKLPGASLA